MEGVSRDLGNVQLMISGENVIIHLKVSYDGNLILEGIGSNIIHELYEDELVLSRMVTEEPLTLKRTHILCPNCMKGRVLATFGKEPKIGTEAYCDRCGIKYKITGENSLKYR